MGKNDVECDKYRSGKILGRNVKSVTGMFIVLLALLALSPVSNAETITVGHTLGAKYWNIQDAINESTDTDIIQVWDGTYNEHIAINKSLIVESRDGTSKTFIDGLESGVVVVITSDDVTFKGFTVQNGDLGIKITGNGNVIIDNAIRNMEGVTGSNSSGINAEIGGDSCGIYLFSGTNNRISRNIISSVTGGTGGNNTFSGGWTYGHGGTGGYGYGLHLKSGKNNLISGNTISSIAGGTGGSATGWRRTLLGDIPRGYGGTGGAGYGIYIDSSDDNKLFNNTVSGVYKGAGGYGNVSSGSAGEGYGIAAVSATNRNAIYHNNFEGSDTQDGYDSGGNNAWDGGSTIGGNYWRDYTGSDTDGDGIGNTPYELGGDKGAKDFFPVRHKNGWGSNDTTPPASVTNLNETEVGTMWLLWTWTNPSGVVFHHTEVYINGMFRANVLAPEHSYRATGLLSNTTYEIGTRTVDDSGNINTTWINDSAMTLPPTQTIFDTGSGTYPSIIGRHNGTIKPSNNITVHKLYTYSCEGTGGHTESARIWNSAWNATATWRGYVEDWHNITFDKPVVLLANETYNYTIRTGSYPQIHHKEGLPTAYGWINCTSFVDVNERTYNDWIPAIKLW